MRLSNFLIVHLLRTHIFLLCKKGTPAFCMVLTGTGDFAYRRTDGVYVVPIGCLKD